MNSVNNQDNSKPDKDSITLAKEGAASVGQFPHLFTSAIRAISAQGGFGVGERFSSNNKLPSAIDFIIKRSPTIRAMLYCFVEENRSSDLTKLAGITVPSLLSLITPGELSAIIGIKLLYRRMRLKCDKEEWKHWTENLAAHMRVCAIVGDTFKRVGFGGGMFAGAMRFLGAAVFLSHDLKGFQEFRRRVKTQKKLFDLEGERAKWGCNHLEICAALVQTLGFGLGVGMGFGMEKLNRRPEMSDEEFRSLEEDTISWQATIKWAESLHLSGKAPPGISKDDIFYLPEDVTAELAAQVKSVVQTESSEIWITRSLSTIPKAAADGLGIDLSKIESDLEEDEEVQAN